MPKMEHPTKLLPRDYIDCSREDLVVLISRMLNSIIKINDQQRGTDLGNENLTRFHSRTPPGISVHSYLTRLSRYSSLENAVLLAAVYYIDTLSQAFSSFTLNSLTVHRYLLTATTVGSKGLCDTFCTNNHYARVGGVNATELEILEREFLIRMDYQILPKNDAMTSNNDDRPDNAVTEQGQRTSRRSRSITNIPNSSEISQFDGFAVLDIYYRKMIEIVGGQTSIDDGELLESFAYQLVPTNAENLHVKHTNTLPDTMSDLRFVQYKQELLQEIGSITQGQKMVGDFQTQTMQKPETEEKRGGASIGNNSTEHSVLYSNGDMVSSTTPTTNMSQISQTRGIRDEINPNLVKSPLKRPMDRDPDHAGTSHLQNREKDKKIRISSEEGVCTKIEPQCGTEDDEEDDSYSGEDDYFDDEDEVYGSEHLETNNGKN